MSKFIERMKGNISQFPQWRIVQWWTLNNWIDAANLLFRLSASFTVIVAIIILALPPNLEPEIIDIYHEVDENTFDKLISSYEVKDFSLQDLEQQRQSLEDSCPEVQWYFWAFNGDQIQDYDISNISDSYPLDNNQIVCHIYAASLRGLADIKVTNSGVATARKAQVIPPRGYRLKDSELHEFDLPPGDEKILTFETISYEQSAVRRYWLDDHDKPSHVIIEFDTIYETADTAVDKVTIVLGILVIIFIWLTTVSRSIWGKE